jgi:hypothetical protein
VARRPLLELLAVVVGGGLFDLGTDLVDPARDRLVVAGAVDDGGLVLGELHALGGAQVVQGHLLQAHARFLGDHLAAGEDRQVLEHCLAPIAEARRLDGGHLDDAAEIVDHQGGQGLTLDILGDDQKRLAGLGRGLEHRQ